MSENIQKLPSLNQMVDAFTHLKQSAPLDRKLNAPLDRWWMHYYLVNWVSSPLSLLSYLIVL
jgi:hypothetical protein